MVCVSERTRRNLLRRTPTVSFYFIPKSKYYDKRKIELATIARVINQRSRLRRTNRTWIAFATILPNVP